MAQLKSLKQIINNIAEKDFIIKKGKTLAQLDLSWGSIVGEDLAQQVQPEKLYKKTLWISTASPAWAQQLHFYQEQIIEKINEHFSRRLVEKIRCVSGGKRGQVLSEKKATISAPTAAELVATESDLQAVVGDENIKHRLALAWSKAKQFLKVRQLRKQTCQECSKEYVGTNPKLCMKCEEKQRQQKRDEVARLLQEVPWAGFENIKSDLKRVGENTFYEIKSELRKKKHDLLRKEIFSYLEQPAQRKKAALLRLILEYVSLRSGLTPDKINDKIIQEILGTRKVRLLKLKGVKI
ncbi:DUF721 domain-containing protein [Candidatus Margulisiibacteriota bacterium]